MRQFEKLPRSIRQAAVWGIGWRNRVRRFGREYERWKDLLVRSSEWTASQRETWQQERLVALAESARLGTRYYAAVLPDPSIIATADSLRAAVDQIPVLEKGGLRSNPKDFRNGRIVEVDVSSTSGSSGSPMQVGHDVCSIQRRFAIQHDHLKRAGIEPLDPSIRLSGRILCDVGKQHRKPWLYNTAENQLFLSTYHLNERHMRFIAEKVNKFRPVLIDGYPSGVRETLRLLNRLGCKLESLRAIVTTAETLYPDIREEISELSGVPVMDYYAASEGVPFIQQCQNGTYHVRWQSGIFEVDNGSSIKFEGDGELVCTSFVQDRMPLIRYRTGDLVSGLKQNSSGCCGCGLVTPTVESIQGRVEDLVYTPDGRAIGMFSYRTLKFLDGLEETQVIQHDYNRFEVNGVVREDYDQRQIGRDMRGSFERVLGYPIRLQFNRVKQLPHGANGKIRLVISKVERRSTI